MSNAGFEQKLVLFCTFLSEINNFLHLFARNSCVLSGFEHHFLEEGYDVPCLSQVFYKILLTQLANNGNIQLMQIGEKIKSERIKKGISLREFSRKLEISAAYLVDIEKGRRLPNNELLQKIADLLEVTVSTLNKYNLEMPKHIRDWIEKHPFFSRLFKFVLRQPDPFRTRGCPYCR